MEDSEVDTKAKEDTFKKPLLVGKIGKLPKKLKAAPSQPPEPKEPDFPVETPPSVDKPTDNVKTEEKNLPYEEPLWSGLPQSSQPYILEILKNGAIIDRINLMERPFWVFGRLNNCHICMQHPTISRYHAVLQYRVDQNPGFYIYDLDSTHGTFLNKNRIRPRSFMKIYVGHMLKLGCSTRAYLLTGPEDDSEAESPLTITEMKQKKEEELRQRQLIEEEKKRKEEERGIDWGMGEDAEEENDLSENPYAQTNNEDLYIDNPKKALRGFFEREGLELEYDCTEQGIGQFLCKVELPIDDEMGKPIWAEVFHKGKKKEAVIQCALEACRILDRHGLLRQATHESKKPKPKNWEENDYYDSDDDTFLDRTGTIEKKRQMRMNNKIPQKAETYESLMEKEQKLRSLINDLESKIADCERKQSIDGSSTSEQAEDTLDSFMKELNDSKPTKQTINKYKTELKKLKLDYEKVVKLVNIAKPTELPPLVGNKSKDESTKSDGKRSLPLFGKRKKVKVEVATKGTYESKVEDDRDEEDDDEEVRKLEEEKEVERRRKRNQRRIQQKHEKAEVQKQKGYDEDAHKEDYNMWVPPSDQTGDGRTALNDKLGY